LGPTVTSSSRRLSPSFRNESKPLMSNGTIELSHQSEGPIKFRDRRAAE
jgi:hypothetical protein